jgi:hypothetical protein
MNDQNQRCGNLAALFERGCLMTARGPHRFVVTMRALVLSLCAMTASAANHANTNTTDIHGGPFSGQTIPGLIVLNTPCALGDSYHFQLDDTGTLRVLGSLSCHGSGGKEICHLSPELSCRGMSDLSSGGTSTYAANEAGVIADGKTYPWVNSAQAVAMFSSVSAKADSRCNPVLYRQARHMKREKPASDKELAAQEACKPVLDQLCKASNGGQVQLSDGKDVTILCH